MANALPTAPANQAAIMVTEGTPDIDAPLARMNELLVKVVESLQFQNVDDAESSVRSAAAVYAEWEKKLGPAEQLALRLFKGLIQLFSAYTRAIVSHIEGRFSQARLELDKALAVTEQALENAEEFRRLAGEEAKPAHAFFQASFAVFSVIIRGYDLAIQAEAMAYDGDTIECVRLLRLSVAQWRAVDDLPPSESPNEVYLFLARLCTVNANRLERRAEAFENEANRRQSEGRYVKPTGDKIFVIHGHDEAKRRELVDLVEDELGLKTMVMKDEAPGGNTLIEKFEECALECGYAFALVTPDDFVTVGKKKVFQPRPNVLFEIGWFYGHYGRDRVCIVKKADTPLPSDLGGIGTIDFRENVEEAYVRIRDELTRAGLGSGRTGRGKKGRAAAKRPEKDGASRKTKGSGSGKGRR